MKTFKQFIESMVVDITDLVQYFGGKITDDDDDYIVVEFDNKDALKRAIDQLPEDLDFEINLLGNDVSDSFEDDGEEDECCEDEDPEEIDFSELEDGAYELVIYLDNTDANYMEDGDDDEEMDESAQIDERVRKIKVNYRGKRRIKIKCKKGFVFDGKRCVKISGTDMIVKRKAIRKAIRTKKRQGPGRLRKTIRLRKRAMMKRKSMGLVNTPNP